MLKQTELNDFAPIPEDEIVDAGDDYNAVVLRRKRLSAYEQWRKWFLNIPLVGWIITGILDFIRERFMQVSRRRRSFKLSLYFQMQMIAALAGFLLFFIIAIRNMSAVSDTALMDAECILDTQYTLPDGSVLNTYQSDGLIEVDTFFTYTISWKETLLCGNDSLHSLNAACSLSEYNLLSYLMLIEAIVFLFSMVMCLLIYIGFKFFSNIPMESLDIDTTSCKVSFLGTMSRHGPWLSRFLTIINLALVLAIFCVPLVGHVCYGTIETTSSCVSMFDDCFANQMENCRYYYSENCVGPNLPHKTLADAQANVANCKDPSFATRFSGRMDARNVYPTVCTRCWALHSDCKDPYINRMWLTEDKTSSQFVYTSQYHESPAVFDTDPDLITDIYCRCIEGNDKVGSETEDKRILFFDTAKLLAISSPSCTGVVNSTSAACPAILKQPFIAPEVDSNATVFSSDWSSYVFNSTREQGCWWGPQSEPAFFFANSQCTQTGSALYRYILIACYVILTIIVLLIIVGFSIRNTVQAETWSYSPQDPQEAWYWKGLRAIGPG